jgi:hypothetical protein
VPLSLDKERQKGDYEKMLSSNRLALRLSRYLVPGVLGILVAGCPDPEGEFSDFSSRVPTAENIDAPPGAIANVSGTFLAAVTVPNVIPEGKSIQFISTQTLSGTEPGAMLTVTLQALKLPPDLTPVGTPVVLGPTPVNASGQFEAGSSTQVTFPMEANPLGTVVLVDNLVIKGTIRSADLHCGTVGGTVPNLGNLDLAAFGTTYAAIRITPGTIGPALPLPLVKCP